jgi:hypothetical protein
MTGRPKFIVRHSTYVIQTLQITDYVSCPRSNQPQNEVLKVFQRLTPAECDFSPIRLWAMQTKKKSSLSVVCLIYSKKQGYALPTRESGPQFETCLDATYP